MRAKKSLGQNFLQDYSIINRIVEALEILSDDIVIEIGPGRGALTERLLDSGVTVIAVEIDRDLIPELMRKFQSAARFKIIEADFLTADLDGLIGDISKSNLKIVGNLPYYISTPIIRRLIAYSDRFERAVLMLQREVVDRLVAVPGESERGFVTVLAENAFHAEKLFDVPPGAFIPVPKVWSSVVRLTPRPDATSVEDGVVSVLSAGFAQKRKTILNNLKVYAKNAGELLELSGIDPVRRAETLTLDEWKALHAAFKSKNH